MPPQDPFDRLTILERAQLLHDSTLRRHSDSLERHETQLLVLRQLAESQTRTLTRLEETMSRLTDNHISFAATLASHDARMAALESLAQRLVTVTEAIKDMLNRPNGH
jgi:chromosome segregation ATPase